ncbi:TPA: hypothetical protein ACGO1T_001870 [Streptococcus suis]
MKIYQTMTIYHAATYLADLGDFSIYEFENSIYTQRHENIIGDKMPKEQYLTIKEFEEVLSLLEKIENLRISQEYEEQEDTTRFLIENYLRP